MAQEEVLRLVARAQDDASAVFKKLRENMKALKDGAEGPKESTHHLKLMHREAVRGAVEMKKHYRELREHLDKVTESVNQRMEPAFSLLGVKSAAATLSVAALGEAIKGFAERGADLEAFARKARLSVDTIRGMEGAADIFHVDRGELDANLQSFTDAMYLFRRKKGEFYANLHAQRQDEANAMAATPETAAGNEKALRIWLANLQQMMRDRRIGEAAARAYSKQYLGSDSFVDMLRDGTAGLDKAIAEYNKAAGKMDTKKSQDFMESLAKLQHAAEGLRNDLGNTLLPQLTEGVTKLAEAVKAYGPDFANGITTTFNALGTVAKDVWPKVKEAIDDLDPAVQKIGGWHKLFEALAIVRLATFAGSVTGLSSAIGALGGALNALPLGVLATLAKLADDRGILQAPKNTSPREMLKALIDPALIDRLWPEGGAPAPSGGFGQDGNALHRNDETPGAGLFHRSSFSGGRGLLRQTAMDSDLTSTHSAFEEAIARGTAAGVVKGLSDYAGQQQMMANGGVTDAAYHPGGGFGGSDNTPIGRAFARAKSGMGGVPNLSGAGGRSVGHFFSAQEREANIRSYAASIGINPDYAMAVARSEGFGSFVGDKGTSFGDFQMHIKNNIRGLSLGGLGDLYRKATGKNPWDPKNELELDHFALDQARKGGWGPWHGAAARHIYGFAGINRNFVPKHLPAPGELSTKSDKSRGVTHKIEGAADINVKVLAPRGTQVSSASSGLFKPVNLSRGYSMTPASETG